MKIGVGDRPPRIDPRDAKAMTEAELFALAGHPLPVGSPIAGKSIYVPRIPIDAAEAMAMLDMMTIRVSPPSDAFPNRCISPSLT
jgi:hypothetical protein